MNVTLDGKQYLYNMNKPLMRHYQKQFLKHYIQTHKLTQVVTNVKHIILKNLFKKKTRKTRQKESIKDFLCVCNC
jgi:uncharacterized protein (UPF0128 family)